MLNSTTQDEEPDVDKEEQNELSEMRNSIIMRESYHSPEEIPENHNMLTSRSDQMSQYNTLLQELGTRFHNNGHEIVMGPEEDDAEQSNSLELNNNGDGKPELPRCESPSASYSQSVQSLDDRINKDHDFEIIGHEELMRATKWSSIKKKVRDKFSRNSISGCYIVSYDKFNDGNSSQKYSPYSPNDPLQKARSSHWYTTEVADNAKTEDGQQQQQPSETTHRKHEPICSIREPHFKQNPGAVYTFSIQFEPRKYKETSGFSDCFMSDPLKAFDSKICLKVLLNKRKEGLGYFSLKLRSASEACQDFKLVNYPHKRTIIVGLPSPSPITFVDEPPFGEDLGHTWADDVYWHSKDIPHKLLERHDRLTIKIHLIIEPLFPLIQDWESDSGVLTWKIRNYRQNLQNEKDGMSECLRSPYFYSHQRGYRLRARLFLNGAGPAAGAFMSVFLDFLTGQWDDFLPPSLTQFSHETTFTLLDQSENERKLDLTRTEVNTRGFGTGDFFYDFVPLAALQEDLHFRRDTLVLRITVKPVDIARDSTWSLPFVAPPKPPVPCRPTRK